MMQLTWRDAESIELVPGYGLQDASGETVQRVGTALVAFEGGFLHVALTGVAVQVVSAPAVRRVVLLPTDQAAGGIVQDTGNG